MEDRFNGLRIKQKYHEWIDDATFFDYYMRMKEIAINEFEWINLPPTCDERFLELILFEFGYVLFFKHRENGAFLTLQTAIGGRWNMYRIPTTRNAYAVTGLIQECNDEDSVIIFNNRLRQPTSLTIELYAQRLTEIERTISVNINAQKTPILVRGSKSQAKQLQKMYKEYSGNAPVIFGDDDTNLKEMFDVFVTEAPERYPQLMLQKQRVWNEAMTFLGVNNANTEKKERMITNEVDANNEQITAARTSRLQSRKDACKIINELFAEDLEGREIDVRFRNMGGGESNGEIYDGARDSDGSDYGSE